MSVLSDWTSCLTPAFTRSSRPTRFPFFPFPFSSAIAILFSAHVAADVLPPPAERESAGPLSLPEHVLITKFTLLPLRPLVQLGDIHQDLAVRSLFHMGAIHRTRCGPLKIDSLAVVTATMAGTLEFVLARFPVGGTTQVCAASVDHKDAVGGAIYPYAVLLLPLGVDT